MFEGSRVSLVFPAYNEAEFIGEAVREALGVGLFDEIIVVDNNSVDGTGDLAREAGARVVPCAKQGYGNALQAGMAASTGDYIVLCEPDGTFSLKDVRKLLAYVDDFDVVLGTRTNAELVWQGANMRWDNRAGNVLVAKLLEWLFNGPDLSDCGCTFRLMRRSAYEAIRDHLTVGGSHFLPEMVMLFLLTKQSVVEVPVNYRPRRGTSKITGTYKGLVRVARAMVALILSYRFRVWFDRWHPRRPAAPPSSGEPPSSLRVSLVLALVAVATCVSLISPHLRDPSQGDDFDFVSAAQGIVEGKSPTYFRAYIGDGTQTFPGAERQVWSAHPPGSLYAIALFQTMIADPVFAARVMNLCVALATLLLLPWAYRQFYPNERSLGPPLLAMALLALSGTFAVGMLVIDADTCLLPFLWLAFWALYFAWAERGSRAALALAIVILIATILVKATHVVLVPALIGLDQALRARWRRAVLAPFAVIAVAFVPAYFLWTWFLDGLTTPAEALAYNQSQVQGFIDGILTFGSNGHLLTYGGPWVALAPLLITAVAFLRFLATRTAYRAEIVLLLSSLMMWAIYLGKVWGGFRYHCSYLAPLALIAGHHIWHTFRNNKRLLIAPAAGLLAAFVVAVTVGDAPIRSYWENLGLVHTAANPWAALAIYSLGAAYVLYRLLGERVWRAAGAATLTSQAIVACAIFGALWTQNNAIWEANGSRGYGQAEREAIVREIRARLGDRMYLWADPGYSFSLGHKRVIWRWGNPRHAQLMISKEDSLVLFRSREGLLPIGAALEDARYRDSVRIFEQAGYKSKRLPNGDIFFWRDGARGSG